MAIHTAVVTVAPRAPLEIRQVPTPTPKDNEVLVRSEWTASTPLDLHQNDGHLLVTPPQILGDGVAGTVIQVGPGTTHLKENDRVFGFVYQNNAEKAHQEIVCAPENLFGLLPGGLTMQEAVTVPNNFVTVFHTVTADFGLRLPWPKPEAWVPQNVDGKDVEEEVILIWGGSSSVGQYALQVLRWYGYKNLLATASKRNHSLLKEYGASSVFDYNDPSVTAQISAAAGDKGVKYILDCIGSQSGSLAPIAEIAGKGTIVAVLLPVIVRDASEVEAPEYAMDVEAAADWREGVVVRGVRTHFYQDNPLFKEHLQATIMPQMLKMGCVKPNRQKFVEGKTLLNRAQRAMDMLRRKEVSGERLVWKVSHSLPDNRK